MSNKSTDPIDKRVGRRVKVARLAAEISQEAMGAKLGVTFQQVQKYENGKNRISASRLFRIAVMTGQPVEWFFSDVPDSMRKAASSCRPSSRGTWGAFQKRGCL